MIPSNILKKYSVIPLEKAYYDIHNPLSETDKTAAAERIALEEYFVLVSAFKIIKGGKNAVRINNYSSHCGRSKEIRFEISV